MDQKMNGSLVIIAMDLEIVMYTRDMQVIHCKGIQTNAKNNKKQSSFI